MPDPLSVHPSEFNSLCTALARAARRWFAKHGVTATVDPNAQPVEQWITPRVLAAQVGCATKTVQLWLTQGKVPGARRTPRGFWRIPADAAEHILTPPPADGSSPVRKKGRGAARDRRSGESSA